MTLQNITTKIYEIRGIKVMLDYDLAELYQVPTKSLNLSVKRNIQRFPEDFMFQLSLEEWNSLRFQIETLEKVKGRHKKYLPYAFTEQGLAMLSGILNSSIAIDVNIWIMRSFVLMRQFALSHKDLTEKIKEMESRYNQRFQNIYEAIDYLMKNDESEKKQKNRKRIGFN